MSSSQERVENLLRERANARRPRIEYALNKIQRKLENKEDFIANAEARARRKVDAMERMVVQYKENLKLLDEGSYPGYNGLPFGAIPGLDMGGL